MWLITNFGFFSAVARKGKDLPNGDNRTIQIRARDAAHLNLLRERYMGDELGPNVKYPSSDYQVRAFCTPEALGRATYAVSQEIDYTNFKDSVTDTKLHDAAFKVWNAFADIYGTNYSWEKGSAKSYYSRQAGTRSFRSTAGVRSGYAAGDRYQSVFGEIEGDDTVTGWPRETTAYSITSPSGRPSKYDPFESGIEDDEPGQEVEVFGSLVEDADVLNDWDDDDNFLGTGNTMRDTEDRIAKLIEKYLPPPEDLPDVLSAREVKDYLRITNRMLREFLAANKSWKTFKTTSGRYEFPKAKLLFLEEDFNVWHAEKMSNEKTFLGV